MAHDAPSVVPPLHCPAVRRISVCLQVPPGHCVVFVQDRPALVPPKHTPPSSPLSAPGKSRSASVLLFDTTRSSRWSLLKSASTPWDRPELVCWEFRLFRPPVPSFTRTRTSPSGEPPPELLSRINRSVLREQAAPTLEEVFVPHDPSDSYRKTLSSAVPQTPSRPAAVSGSCPGL